ncbi:MAG: hypothetical protein KAJ75_09215, partial [Alphaproteobacteria bacterium]|nr:hypothetical protein [Alphaproteobacteria bacterium]
MKSKILSFFHRKLDKEHHGEHPPEVKGMSHFKKSVSQKKDTKNLEKAKMIASAVSALVVLHYQKKNGTIKKRRVTIRRIWQRGDEILVDGFCHEKKAPRIFKASNIK